MSDSTLPKPQFFDTFAPHRTSRTGRTTIGIRMTQPEDLDGVAILLSHSFYTDLGWWHWVRPVIRMGIYQDLQARFLSRHSQWACLVGVQRNEALQEIPGQFVGTVEIAMRPLSPWSTLGSVPYLSNLAVAPHHRGHGVGQRLLLVCEQLVRQWGQRDVYLHVLSTNRSARQLYAKVGYRVQHQELQWPFWLLGQPQRLLLHKRIRD